MLKKSDLAKQFELVVKQEIKNYQDSLNFVLQSIKELKENILQVQQESLENHALLHSIQGDLTMEMKSLKEALLFLGNRFDRAMTDQRVLNERNQTQILDLTADVLKKINVDSNFQINIQNLWNEIYKIRDVTETNHRIVNDNLDDLYRRLTTAISKAKKEIMEGPTEAKLVKAQLEEQLAAHNVDVAGIMKELRIYKHDNMVTQKKIENIYTLIERLKKSEAIH